MSACDVLVPIRLNLPPGAVSYTPTWDGSQLVRWHAFAYWTNATGSFSLRCGDEYEVSSAMPSTFAGTPAVELVLDSAVGTPRLLFNVAKPGFFRGLLQGRTVVPERRLKPTPSGYEETEYPTGTFRPAVEELGLHELAFERARLDALADVFRELDGRAFEPFERGGR